MTTTLYDGRSFADLLRDRAQGPSMPSGSVVNGQMWDVMQGRWVNAPTGTPNGPQTPGALPGSGNVANIQTSINPTTLYSSGMTQRTANQAVADKQRMANPTFAMKSFDRPGVSRSAAHSYRAAPGVARGRVDAALAGAQIPFADQLANQQHLLQGQVARAGEFNSLAELLLKLQGLSNYTNQSNVNALAPIFSLFGGMAG